MMLVVDCCIRGDDSATRKYYQAYLKTLSERNIQILELSKLQLVPLDSKMLQKRDLLCANKAFDHRIFQLARQFLEAEEILVAAPFWDLSFPALLKVYLEQIVVNGLTFGYDSEGRCVGYCKAQKLLYFSTCGGYFGKCHLGFEYVKSLAAMLGIEECIPYILEGLDIEPAQRDAILTQAVCKLQSGGINGKGD